LNDFSFENVSNALPTEFAQLYDALAALKKAGATVATRPIVVKQGDSIEDTLRQEGVYGGKSMPIQVDRYVCDLNPERCAFVRGKPVWRIQPNATVVVPDLQLEPVIVHRAATKRARDSLAGIIKEREGCPTFDDACLLYLKNLNRRRPGEIEHDYVGTLTVPTRAYRATLVFESQIAGDLLLLPEAADLRRQAVPDIGGRLNAGGPSTELVEGTRARVLSRIAMPSYDVTTIQRRRAGVTKIAVIDNSADSGHCMLKDVIVFESAPATGERRPAVCGGRADAQKPRDHGTHVVGLISAMVNTEAGPGVNPAAMVTVIPVNADKLTEKEYSKVYTDRFKRLLRTERGPEVVNMSIQYEPKGSAQNDLIWDEIKSSEDNILFVAAAGNDGRMLSTPGDCAIRPACLRARNVITVGATTLGERPTLLKGANLASNYGSAVHIAAPGANIVSTIAMNRVGMFSGTSQAAPLVTGVASLLLLKDDKLRPGQIKNRLIYTSDLSPSLYELMVGGRLNAERALDIDLAQLKRTGKTLEKLVRKNNPTVAFSDMERNGKELLIRFDQIRRLKYEPELKFYALYYVEDGGADSGELTRRFVRLSSNHTIAFADSSGTARPIVDVRLEDIEDYTAAIVR
jgi:subtilisin family serine protease